MYLAIQLKLVYYIVYINTYISDYSYTFQEIQEPKPGEEGNHEKKLIVHNTYLGRLIRKLTGIHCQVESQ